MIVATTLNLPAPVLKKLRRVSASKNVERLFALRFAKLASTTNRIRETCVPLTRNPLIWKNDREMKILTNVLQNAPDLRRPNLILNRQSLTKVKLARTNVLALTNPSRPNRPPKSGLILTINVLSGRRSRGPTLAGEWSVLPRQARN